jgi:hypothetical protein
LNGIVAKGATFYHETFKAGSPSVVDGIVAKLTEVTRMLGCLVAGKRTYDLPIFYVRVMRKPRGVEGEGENI